MKQFIFNYYIDVSIFDFTGKIVTDKRTKKKKKIE